MAVNEHNEDTFDEDEYDSMIAQRALEAIAAGEPVVLWEDVKARLDLDDDDDEPEKDNARPLYETCRRCNYNRHLCPGCGADLPHGTEVCDECQDL